VYWQVGKPGKAISTIVFLMQLMEMPLTPQQEALQRKERTRKR